MGSLLAIPSFLLYWCQVCTQKETSWHVAATFCEDDWVCWKVLPNSMTVSLLMPEMCPHVSKKSLMQLELTG